MTPQEAIETINKECDETFLLLNTRKEFVDDLAESIKALEEVQQYREIGSVEQVKNQKEKLNVAYQIISDYEQYGTIEDFKKAQKYMRLVNAHGTIGQVIDSCAEYERIGTVEECREAREKQIPKEGVATGDELHPVMCPSCKHKLELPYHYCIFCGQKLIYH